MKYFPKRAFDIVFSALGLIILSPAFILISVIIPLDSKGSPIFKQIRVGLNSRKFSVFKFRTMYQNSEIRIHLTVGTNDNRITRVGSFLRRFKLDEIPQLLNVLKGEMSFVGPRPEVPKFVEMYNEQQLRVLTVKPGITDYASIKFRDENELLARVENPEQYYIREVMPRKLALNLFYVKNQSLLMDINLIFKTIFFIFVKSKGSDLKKS